MKKLVKHVFAAVLSMALVFSLTAQVFAAPNININYGASGGNTRAVISSIEQVSGGGGAALRISVTGGVISDVSCATADETDGIGTSTVVLYFEDLNAGESTGSVTAIIPGVQNRSVTASFAAYAPDGSNIGNEVTASKSLTFNSDAPVAVPENPGTGSAVVGDTILSGTPNIRQEETTPSSNSTASTTTVMNTMNTSNRNETENEPSGDETVSEPIETETTTSVVEGVSDSDSEAYTRPSRPAGETENEEEGTLSRIRNSAKEMFESFTLLMWVGFIGGIVLGLGVLIAIIVAIVRTVKKKRKRKEAKARREATHNELVQQRAQREAQKQAEADKQPPVAPQNK